MLERPGAETGRNKSEERRQRELCERNRRQRKRGGPRCAPPRPAGRMEGRAGSGAGSLEPRVRPDCCRPGVCAPEGTCPAQPSPTPGLPRPGPSAWCPWRSPAPQGQLPMPGLRPTERRSERWGSAGTCGAANFSAGPAVLLDPGFALAVVIVLLSDSGGSSTVQALVLYSLCRQDHQLQAVPI